MDISDQYLVPNSQPTSLDAEILHVRRQIQELSCRRATLTAALLASPSSQTLLARARAAPASPSHVSALEKRIQDQKRQNMQNMYRMCSGATMFEARDPDPNAVDNGRITGVRIEVFNHEQKAFQPPYYVMFHRPVPSSPSLHVHRHTIPPRIPLPALVAKYLPPSKLAGDKISKEQDLPRLVKELRRELISYHRRTDAVAKLGKVLDQGRRMSQEDKIKRMDSIDAETRAIRILWENGTAGNVTILNGGEMKSVTVNGNDGKRIRKVERELLEVGRIERLGELLIADTL